MHHIVCEARGVFKKTPRQRFQLRARLERLAVQQLKMFAIMNQGSRPKHATGGQGIMINLTPVASTKVKEIMTMQSPSPIALRVAVVGGGCSGFQYHMAFENQTNDTDQIFEFDGLKVAVDQMSSMYLDGIEIDYIETVEGAGFKFNNPNVKSTCGCGSSFSV
jgi:iron-sulfur cluster assembly accessory protein